LLCESTSDPTSTTSVMSLSNPPEKEPMPSATPTVYERSRHNSNEPSERPEESHPNGVDVAQAKEEFAELSRHYSRQSQGNKDVEKQVSVFTPILY
jgi:hypothetical protein